MQINSINRNTNFGLLLSSSFQNFLKDDIVKMYMQDEKTIHNMEQTVKNLQNSCSDNYVLKIETKKIRVPYEYTSDKKDNVGSGKQPPVYINAETDELVLEKLGEPPIHLDLSQDEVFRNGSFDGILNTIINKVKIAVKYHDQDTQNKIKSAYTKAENLLRYPLIY